MSRLANELLIQEVPERAKTLPIWEGLRYKELLERAQKLNLDRLEKIEMDLKEAR